MSAVWRLSRAERLEADLFAENQLAGWSLGLALIRDCNGARSFDTLLRYRGGALAELWRALRTLKALQAEHAARPEPAVAPAPRLLPEPHETPVEPEARGKPRETVPVAAGGEVVATVTATLPEVPPVHSKPVGPEARGNPGGTRARVSRRKNWDPEELTLPRRSACAKKAAVRREGLERRGVGQELNSAACLPT